MTDIYKELQRAAISVRSKTHFKPEVAIILGSGLGGYANNIQAETSIPFGEIDGFPVSTVEGHAGRLLFGYLEGVPVVCMQGRVHYYEGYSMDQVVLPVRLMAELGARTLILTNAAGGIDYSFKASDLMMITDHISTFVPSPLIGPNEPLLGTRFPDMTSVYSRRLQDMIRRIASDLGIDLKEGVYLQTTGPQYETPAEIRAFRTLGASAVGMSTVCEAIAANHCGMEICGISCITNLAAGMTGEKLTHEEVQKASAIAADNFEKLLRQLTIEIGSTAQ